MDHSFEQIDTEQKADVVCARLRQRRLSEADVLQFGDELLNLITEHGCRKLVVSLGPGPLQCLYSVFLAKLVTARKRIDERGGKMVICEAHPETLHVFEVCQLDQYFDFAPDQGTAVAELSR
jgi:stage II sporulation protein AA (anti-sigma F factor antagonist)